VTLVGAGSVGSPVADYLVQASVGHFRIIDMDTLSPANIARHACNINHLGRAKPLALRDIILARNPQAEVEVFADDFLKIPPEAQEQILRGSDLVIAATDQMACQFCLNERCLDLGLPSLYVGCYTRAMAGELIYVIPGVTPCYNSSLNTEPKA
jgi:molybdopterin/thiamine biosynthesis adenylyltransferase